MLKRIIVMFCLAVVMSVPLEKWAALTNEQRDEIRAKTIQKYMGNWGSGSAARIWEEINNNMWELYIEPTDICLPNRKKEDI